MYRKTTGITFDKNAIEKIFNHTETSSFLPRINHSSKSNIDFVKRPKREDIKITGSVLKKDDLIK